MAVTFTLMREVEPRFFDQECKVDHGICTVAEHLLDDDIAAYSHTGWCVECSGVNRRACDLCGLEVNVNNARAAMLLERLGIEFGDGIGHMDPRDFMGRVLVGNVGRDDSGLRTETGVGSGGAHWTDCGIPAGFFAERFDALADLAQVAVERGCLVGWS